MAKTGRKLEGSACRRPRAAACGWGPRMGAEPIAPPALRSNWGRSAVARSLGRSAAAADDPAGLFPLILFAINSSALSRRPRSPGSAGQLPGLCPRHAVRPRRDVDRGRRGHRPRPGHRVRLPRPPRADVVARRRLLLGRARRSWSSRWDSRAILLVGLAGGVTIAAGRRAPSSWSSSRVLIAFAFAALGLLLARGWARVPRSRASSRSSS